jgi:hypothetical protein
MTLEVKELHKNDGEFQLLHKSDERQISQSMKRVRQENRKCKVCVSDNHL